MSFTINQDIRFSQANELNENNPENLYEFIKPSRIIANNGPPLVNTGENQWYYIDIDTGDFYYKNLGVWIQIYNFSTGSGGEVNDGQNVGGFAEVFKQKLGSILQFRTLRGPTIPINEDFQRILISNPDNTEDTINIKTYAGVNNIFNIGTGGGIFKELEKFGDDTGRQRALFKTITGGSNITIIENDDNIEISTSAASYISNVVNSNEGALGRVLRDVTAGVATLRTITSGGPEIQIQQNADNIAIKSTVTKEYLYIYQNSISYNILSTFVNLPPFVAPLFSSDWNFQPNINGSSFFIYEGPPDVVYSCQYDITGSSILEVANPHNFIFRIAEGDPLFSQVGIPLSGTILSFAAQTPNNITGFNSASTKFLFKPTPNEYYTLQAQCTINNLALSVEEIKLTLEKI